MLRNLLLGLLGKLGQSKLNGVMLVRLRARLNLALRG
jgi:hypothetical protein